MSAVATSLFNKYELSPDTDIALLKKYAIELTPLLPDKNSRKLARRRLLQLGLSKDQVMVLVPDRRPGQIAIDNLSIKDVTARQLAEFIVRYDINPLLVRKFAHEFALLGSTPIAQSSRLSQIRHHLSNLNC